MADKAQVGTPVTLEINKKEIRFGVTLAAFNNYQDEFMPNAKVAPSENFLVKCVHPDDKEEVISLCDQGYTIELAQMVASEFKPALEIKVKK